MWLNVMCHDAYSSLHACVDHAIAPVVSDHCCLDCYRRCCWFLQLHLTLPMTDAAAALHVPGIAGSNRIAYVPFSPLKSRHYMGWSRKTRLSRKADPEAEAAVRAGQRLWRGAWQRR